MKKFLKFIGYGFLVLFGLAILGSMCGKKSGGNLADSQKPEESAYSSAETLDYRKGTLGQYSKGTLLTFQGEINQIIGDDGAMISTQKHGQFGYSGEQALLNFDSKPQLIENDIVIIKGRYIGPKKYTTVLRAEKEVPLIQADYYTVLPKSK